MPRYNINYNNKWACFSSISDGFITKFMDKSEYESWRKEEYGLKDYKPAEQCNTMNMLEAVYSVRLNRTKQETLDCLLNLDLSKDECEQLIYDMESDFFVPKKENELYRCPNCNAIVKPGQLTCNKEYCEHELIWRGEIYDKDYKNK